MNISGIYQIQSRIKPDRIYIGSAINIHRRWRDHLCKLRLNKHDNSRLQNHYNKYGKNDLVFSVIIGCSVDDLIATEQFYIDSKKCWFNLCPKAGSSLGIKHSMRSREKNRLAKLGLKHSEQSRKQRSLDSMGEKNHFFGKTHSPESNEKRREWNRLHPVSKETREKQRLSLIRYYEEKRFKELKTINQN